MATHLPEIKLLSLQDYFCKETRPMFLQQMHDSLTSLGTFYIRDHGVPQELTSRTMKTVQDYFALPLQEKKKMMIGNSRHFRGYKLMGQEVTNNEIDHREQLQFAPEREAVESFVPSISRNYEGLQGPNQWPLSTLARLPEFKDSILEFMTHLETLSQHLMAAVALSLGLDASFFCQLFGKAPYYRLKCARYPSVVKTSTIGCGAHKDTGFLTVLLQDLVGGLQGQDPTTGQWMDTHPVPETFIVTMGESIEKLTGGLYRATVHRVLSNTSGQDRYSIPFFFDPALDAQIPYRIPNLNPGREITARKSSTSGMSISTGSLSSLVSNSDSDSDVEFDKEELERLVDTLEIQDGDDNTTTDDMSDSQMNVLEGWSNGDHIFETVHRCHPEVFSHWYRREL
ncbi:hypothetical protein EDD11_003924 [Mortierella claussenii]|nr:hypothetical protein EDD11_003924 [Mortierella claussenii]